MRILIYAKKSSLKNVGGPLGYLYNINEYLKANPSSEISFLPEKTFSKTLTDILFRGTIVLLLNIVNKVCKPNSSIKFLLFIYYTFYVKRRYSKEALDFYNQFDYIHVHDTRKILTDFYPDSGVTAKIILTSHSPEPLIDEIGNSQKPGFFSRHPKLYKFLLKREAKAYDFCDRIMFPVKEAREPYEQSSSIFKEIFAQNEHKFFYVPTALNVLECDETNNHLIDSLDIDAEALKICYIGRHNSVKGYDFLKDIAPKIWKVLPTSHFIIGGNQVPLKGLDEARWHELGWVHTPSLLNEVDVFILPNKQTYFDLILLEVLRQGTPVILSRTGGNKWFETNKKTDGIFFYDKNNHNQLIEQIEEIYRLKSLGLLEEIKQNNKSFFKSEFNMSTYITRYLSNLKGDR